MLDEVRAPLRVCSFVAYAPDKPDLPTAAGQEARFEAVMAFFEQQKRWPSPGQLSLLARQASWMTTSPPDPDAPPGARDVGELRALPGFCDHGPDPRVVDP